MPQLLERNRRSVQPKEESFSLGDKTYKLVRPRARGGKFTIAQIRKAWRRMDAAAAQK
jgi:hypothetical protein